MEFLVLPVAKCPRWTDPSRSPPCSSLNKDLGEVSWVEVPGLELTFLDGGISLVEAPCFTHVLFIRTY